MSQLNTPASIRRERRHRAEAAAKLPSLQIFKTSPLTLRREQAAKRVANLCCAVGEFVAPR